MPDKALVERTRQGDRAAFEALVSRHQGVIYGYLRVRLLQHSDAEDLTQEVFLRWYQTRTGFDDSNMVRPWLIGIARNVLREHLRRIRRRKETAWAELCLEAAELAEGDESAPDEMLARLPACLDLLGRSARQAIDLRYAAKLGLAEIGQRLGRTQGAVKQLMFRARAALKSCLDRAVRRPADE